MSKKDDERVDKSRLLEDVQEFCISQSFEAQFEAFAKEHANVFLKALDFTDESNEHPLEFHEVYRKYLTKFEGLIEDFIVKVRIVSTLQPYLSHQSYQYIIRIFFQNGYNVGDFYDQCKDILDNDEVFGTKRFFIETMLATSEYQNFFMLMRAEMREYKQAMLRDSHK